MSQLVELVFHSSRYGRKSEKVIRLSYSDLDPRISIWLWPAIEQFSNETFVSQINLTVWDNLSHAIPGLIHVPCWEGFTTLTIGELEVEDIRDLYIDIDDAFHQLWGADRGALRSAAIRAFVSKYLLTVRPDGLLERVKGTFVPKGRANHKPRSLISDLVFPSDGTVKEPPVGALPHSNATELKVKTKKRLEDDIARIEEACVKELEAYHKACSVIYSICHRIVDRKHERSALKKLKQRGLRVSEKIVQMSKQEREALTAYYIRFDHSPTAPFAAPNYLGSHSLCEGLCESMGIQKENFQKCIRYKYYPRQTVYVAAILLLQTATAWNIGSVMELTEKGIRPGNDGKHHTLQSIKSKTSDDTPLVLIEGENAPVVLAIRFALDRLAALKSRGWLPLNEFGLWMGPRSNYASSWGQPISNLSHGLHELQQKYHLPHFTFEQIRTQKLTIVHLEKGPISAAEMAGHTGYGSIGGYIDHLLTRRTNSSVNLEFQRRWEAEVLKRIEGTAIAKPLVPIGDGSSCLDSGQPPDDAWLNDGVCNAHNCHTGVGCPNRVVKIDSIRIQEIKLTRQYYERNWQRLYAGNPQAFALIHMPRLEFNACLYEYVKQGPYRHLLNG